MYSLNQLFPPEFGHDDNFIFARVQDTHVFYQISRFLHYGKVLFLFSTTNNKGRLKKSKKKAKNNIKQSLLSLIYFFGQACKKTIKSLDHF